jgi:hypothetical protein
MLVHFAVSQEDIGKLTKFKRHFFAIFFLFSWHPDEKNAKKPTIVCIQMWIIISVWIVRKRKSCTTTKGKASPIFLDLNYQPSKVMTITIRIQ